MASRLLARLDAQIAAANRPHEVACLRAQQANYHARQGQHELAESIVKSIRAEFDSRPHAEVTVWVSLCEGLIQFFRHPGPQALDRLRRAHALSAAVSHPVLQPLCAAWLAHMEFNASRMPEMLKYASETMRLAQPEHHAAWARLSLVLADAFHFAGRFDLAKPWYAAVREHALADGDDAMISAMLHNVATLRANQLRLVDTFGLVDRDETQRALLEAESTASFDAGVGSTSFASLVPLLRAQVLTAGRQYATALELYDENLDASRPESLRRRHATYCADRAWCLHQLGMAEAALAAASTAESELEVGSDIDDLATTHGRISRIFAEHGRAAHAASHRALADKFFAQHSVEQAQLLNLLLELPPYPAASK